MSDDITLIARLLEHLRGFDTPTICNALEVVLGNRQTSGFTRKPVVCAFVDMKPIVGFARTATISAVAPSTLPAAEARELRLAYYDYVAAPPHPSLVVIQDLDPEPGLGAFWGEVNTAVHKGLGVQGCLTNGSIRDLDMIAPEFQLLAGSVGPSHAFVHVEAIQVEVEVLGLKVRHGDLIHADRHGATIIPLDALEGLPDAIDLCIRKERPILEAARSADFSAAKLRAAMSEADDIH